MTKIAKNISVDVNAKIISWDDPWCGRYQLVIDVTDYAHPQIASYPFLDKQVQLSEELDAYLEKPRKTLGGKSYEQVLVESRSPDVTAPAAIASFIDNERYLKLFQMANQAVASSYKLGLVDGNVHEYTREEYFKRHARMVETADALDAEIRALCTSTAPVAATEPSKLERRVHAQAAADPTTAEQVRRILPKTFTEGKSTADAIYGFMSRDPSAPLDPDEPGEFDDVPREVIDAVVADLIAEHEAKQAGLRIEGVDANTFLDGVLEAALSDQPDIPQISQGVMSDGAAILEDGRPLRIEEIISRLQHYNNFRYAFEKAGGQ